MSEEIRDLSIEEIEAIQGGDCRVTERVCWMDPFGREHCYEEVVCSD
ncbi:hypothetical protein [Agarilytica rhodophyticola]|nr:hypothetical protein [Agarilytica rhodophyticola]